MCLLKRSEHDTNCGHDECKNFYMLNKQMCMYNLTPQSQATVTPQNVTLSSIHPQIQLSTLLSQKPTTIVASQPVLNGKRLANPPIESDQETFYLNKKQIKSDVEENKNEDNNQATLQNNFVDLNILSQQIINQNSADRNGQQAAFINGINPANTQIVYAKQDGTGLQYGNSTIYIPFVQSAQANTNPNQTFAPIIAPTAQNGFNIVNGSQLFSQNMRIKPSNNNNSIVNVNPISLNAADINRANTSNTPTTTANSISSQSNISPSNTNNAAVEAMMKEFQSRISDLLLSQNKMLIDLKEKNEIIQDTLACLINEMSSLKSAIKHTSQEKPVQNGLSSLMTTNINLNSNETATTEGLINYLYGPNPDFQYQLLIKTQLPLPLYRERNFKFTLVLTDKNGNPVENTNKIPLTIAIYSSESVPKYIDANTAGNKILKGFIDRDLVNGSATFDKIQIKEVTSHFRNGWVFFVVYPKVSNTGAGAAINNGKQIIVNSQKIRPFIIEKVVVKAKKAKEKDNEESEDQVFQETNNQEQTNSDENRNKEEIQETKDDKEEIKT